MSLGKIEPANDTRGAISMRNVGISFGEGQTAVEAVRNINLDIESGGFLSVLGPSGCGKSTLVGAVAGFTPLSTGELLVDGQPVRRPGADRGVVFQQHTLFPWKTVRSNVEFGLKMRGVGRAERREKAEEILLHVGLGDFLRHYPSQLSGGMQQRVSLARVLVNRPRVLLMDEPFSALDAQTRLQMQEMLLDLWREFHMTVLFVTHDIDEAVYLGSRVAVLTRRPGCLKAIFEVNLPRPRETDVLVSPEFMRLKKSCMDLVRGETLRAPGSKFKAAQDVDISPNAFPNKSASAAG
jgi:NitT/TauT family transport system ATP-binding protein